MQIKEPPSMWFGSCYYMWLLQFYAVPLETEELLLKLLLAELCAPQIHILKSLPPLLQNVTVFEDGIYSESD